MEEFIDAITKRRIEAQEMISKGNRMLCTEEGKKLIRKGTVLKDFYKLINNSLLLLVWLVVLII